jgi:hypothetical protein
MKGIAFTLFVMILMSFLILGIKERKKHRMDKPNSPVSVKYEIITSAPVVNDSGSGEWMPYLYYSDSSGNYVKGNIFTSGRQWSRTVKLKNTLRPLFMHFLCSLKLADTGTVRMAIYVNGKLTTSESIPTNNNNASTKNLVLAGVSAFVQ